jgi:hypothetical protein
MRMWIPQAAVDEGILRAQIDDLANAGVGDVEIVAFDFVRGASATATPAIDRAVYGWGTANWAQTMKTVLDQAGKRGMTATFTIGPAWPVASPLLTPSSPGVEVQLACTRVDVSGRSYNGEVTGNVRRNGISSQLVAVVAGKRLSAAPTSALDPNTMVDLAASVSGSTAGTASPAATLDWTTPDDSGQWTLFFYWSEPVGEMVNGSYVVDHFSTDGTKAVTDYYASVYADFAKAGLLQHCRGLFGDSLEYRASVDWTNTLLTTFKRLKGYDLTRYLPAINNGVSTGQRGGFGGGFGKESFGGLGDKVANDYYDVLTYLFTENHLKPLREFLDNYGQTLRYQTAYGKRMEQARTSMHVGIPEGEMMMIRNAFDNIRAQAGAVHMTDRKEYNAELQAEGRKNHAQSWENLLFFAQRAYAAGVNNITIHGYNYKGVFSGAGSVNGHLPNVAWPGWDGFSRDGYSNSWGSEPLWRQARQYFDFMARNSYVLKQGAARIDLAIFRESFWDNASFSVKDGDMWYKDGGLLQDRGYSYDFVGLPNLQLPTAIVSGGRLDADGPAYKALILDQSLDTSNIPGMPASKKIGVEAAGRILALAKAGLPVVYIGNTPTESAFHRAGDQAAADSQVQSIMAELKGLPNVRQARAIGDVPAALDAVGVRPDARYSLAAHQPKLINIHRAAKGIDYYYVYNRGFNGNSGPAYGWGYGGAKEQSIPEVSTAVTFAASGRPYLLNAWSGDITPIAVYAATGNTVTIPLSLRGNESAIVAFDGANVLGVGAEGEVHATSGGPATVHYDQRGDLAVKATANGRYEIALSNGTARRVDVRGVPAPVRLGPWRLTVEDWKPGNTPTTTAIGMVTVELGSLRPWTSVPELEHSSGVGKYTTSFEMERGWRDGVGAYLDLGIVNFGYRLRVNGTDVRSSQTNTTVDIGPYLKAGTNTLEVEIATSLNNRLKNLYNIAARTLDYYGLLGYGGTSATDGLGGVVTVTPYVETVVHPFRNAPAK